VATLPETTDVIIAFGTLFTGVAATWAAVVAHRGLTSWKAQQSWTRDRDLAKDLLVLVCKRRDAVSQIRSPFGYISQKALNDRDAKWQGLKSDYEKRFSGLADVTQAFYSLQYEAYALWGEGFLKTADSLRSLEMELLTEVEVYLDGKNPIYANDDYFSSREDAIRNKNVVMARGVTRDEFGPKYTAAVTNCELYLRKKINA